jgi:hypothetical protein
MTYKKIALCSILVIAIAFAVGTLQSYAQIETVNPAVEFTQKVRVTSFNTDGVRMLEDVITRSYRADGAVFESKVGVEPKMDDPVNTLITAEGRVFVMDTLAHTVGTDQAGHHTVYTMTHRPNPCVVDAKMFKECGPSELRIAGT